MTAGGAVHGSTRRVLLSLVALLACARAGVTADVEETERRIKAAGIEPELRTAIHAAIDRAVAHLVATQDAAGAWDAGEMPPEPRAAGLSGGPMWSAGVTALCGLALRHAGTAAGRKAAARALAWLRSTGRGPLKAEVYVAGIGTLLLHAERSDDALALKLTDWLAQCFRRQHGSWAYGTPAGSSELTGFAYGPNLSTAQFACLGLWAGERLGASVPSAIWRRHLDMLLLTQEGDGSWPYTPPARGWSYAYATGAFMGLANLLLASARLQEDLREDAALAERVAVAELRGRSALRRYARWTLRGEQGFARQFATPYYELFALEKAGVFAGVDALGTVRWYRDGARRLLALQRSDGGWNGKDWHLSGFAWESDALATAFALLFLLRVSESHHPVTPRPVDTPPVPPVVTGNRPEAAAAPEAPTVPMVILDEARRRSATLEALLTDERATNAALLAALDAVGASYGRLDPASPAAEREAWKASAEEVVLRALRLALPVERTNSRARVDVRAARVLAGMDARVALALLPVLEREVFVEKRFDVGVDLYEAAFDVLAASRHPVTLQWLVDRVASEREPRHWVRTTAALVALQGFGSVPRTARRSAARALAATWGPVEEAAEANPTLPNGVNGPFGRFTEVYVWWQQIRPDVVIAFLDLAASDAPGGEPRARDGNPLTSIRACAAWLDALAGR